MTWAERLGSVKTVQRGNDAPGQLHPPLLGRVNQKTLQGIDYAIAFVLLLATAPRLIGGGGPHLGRGGGFLFLALGAALPIAIRRRAPLLSLGIATVSISIATAIGQSFAPDPLIALPVYQVASVRERRVSVPAIALTAGALLIATAVAAVDYPRAGLTTFSVLLALAAWFVGDSVRVRRAYSAGLAEQAAQRGREALERAQRGVAEERLRIARELHDVIAHSLSVIAVQSAVGRHVIDAQPEQAKAALEAVESTSRGALVELRRMLGVLREEDAGKPDLTPAPGIADLGSLVKQIEATGLPVELAVDQEVAGALSPSVGLTVYRIVQEALTNVVKHGGPAARTRVELRRERDELVVEVSDDGGGVPATYPDAAGGEQGHHGIVGMRERVALFNGTLAAGPRQGGGFRVLARLPERREP